MAQSLDKSIWELYDKALSEKGEKAESKVTNGKREDRGLWIDKIVSKIRISDLAVECGVEECPECSQRGKKYALYFDDSNGFFCCVKRKFGGACDFCGNIVDFVARCGK